jgi:uncharacterized protein YdeI (YjbR/CyaY-like superfamily)
VKTLEAPARAEWRLWLRTNAWRESEIWLVFPKVATGRAALSYDDVVVEAICFGWIDSTVRRIDEDRYARKFTPRKPGSVWSDINKARAERAIEEGRMTERGLRLIRHAKESGEWERVAERLRIDEETPPKELSDALAEDSAAMSFFESLPRSCRKQYIIWVAVAKRPETRARRAAEAAGMLGRGERLGLK